MNAQDEFPTPIPHLVRYLAEANLALPPSFIDDAFLRATGNIRGRKNVSWGTIRACLSDAKAAQGGEPPPHWPEPRLRRYRATLRRARELQVATQARDADVLLDLAYHVYLYVRRPDDLLPRPEPGTVLPGYLWAYEMPSVRRKLFVVGVVRLLQATINPVTRKAFSKLPPLPSQSHKRLWRDFTGWTKARHNIAGPPLP